MSFWNITKDATTGNDELCIDGEISMQQDWWFGGRVVARDFRAALKRCGDVTVYINSPGGDVFAAAEIYTALREHTGKVVVKVSGIAASAASLVAMAGDEVLMSPVAYMMIHNPWSYAQGNAKEFEKQAAILREIAEGLITAYTARTHMSRDEIAALLDTDTYMSAQKCVDLGFADGILYEDAKGSAQTAQQPAPNSTLMKASAHGRTAVLALLQAETPAPAQSRPQGIFSFCGESAPAEPAAGTPAEGADPLSHAHQVPAPCAHTHTAPAPAAGVGVGATLAEDTAKRAEIAARAAAIARAVESVKY